MKVYVDGDYVGRTPLDPLALSPGRHAVRLKSRAHKDVEQFVDVVFGDVARLEVTLEKTEVRAVAKARPPRPPIAIGLVAGVASNFAALTVPALSLTSDYAIALAGDLYGGVEIELTGSRFAGQARLLPGRDSAFETQVTAVPIRARLGYRLLPDRLAPYLLLTAGVAWISEETTSPDFAPVRVRALRLSGRGAVGLDFQLSFGEVFLEVGGSYIQMPVEGAVVGGLAFFDLRGGVRIRP